MMNTRMNPTDTDMMNNAINAKSVNLLRMKGAKTTGAQIDKTAGEFESQFVSEMLGTMSETVDEDEMAGSDAQDVYTSMLNNEYGKIIARTGGIGVASQVKQVMLKQQEVE